MIDAGAAGTGGGVTPECARRTGCTHGLTTGDLTLLILIRIPFEMPKGPGQSEGGRVLIAPTPFTSPEAPLVLLLLALEAGYEHLLGPLGSLQIVLQHTAEELNELLVTLCLGILDVALQGLYVL
jgi:hypothetical protein